jgi:truncated hemoglobin YjbI
MDADLERQMDNHPAVDWDEVARHAIRERAQTLELLDEATEDIELTEADAAELADRVDEIARKRIEEES